jgi:hypothetical protein
MSTYVFVVSPVRRGRIYDALIDGTLLTITVGLGGTLAGALLAVLLSRFLSALARDLEQAAKDQAG